MRISPKIDRTSGAKSYQITLLRKCAHSVMSAFSLVTACSQSPPEKSGIEKNPLMARVEEYMSSAPDFRSRLFSEQDGWKVWYLQLDIGATCVASKPADHYKPAPAAAIYMRQSIGDLRLDVWIDATSQAFIPPDPWIDARVPNTESSVDVASGGYFRPPGAAFFHGLLGSDLESSDGKTVTLKPATPIPDVPNGTINLAGIKWVKAALLKCEAGKPKS